MGTSAKINSFHFDLCCTTNINEQMSFYLKEYEKEKIALKLKSPCEIIKYDIPVDWLLNVHVKIRTIS